MGMFSTNYCPRAGFAAGIQEGTRVIIMNNRDGATQLILGVYIPSREGKHETTQPTANERGYQ